MEVKHQLNVGVSASSLTSRHLRDTRPNIAPTPRGFYGSPGRLQPHATAGLRYKCALYSSTCSILSKQEHTCNKHGHNVRAIMDSNCGDLLQLDDQTTPDLNTLSNGAIQPSFLKRLDAFYRFTRPYAIMATVLGVTSVSLLAVQTHQEISLEFAMEIVRTLIPTILMNIYIVGINQVFDIDIDKVNKPSLPLASGEFSLHTGISLTILSATLSFAFGAFVSSKNLTRALILGFLLGTGYSLEFPLLRWKKWGLTTAITILLYRTFAVQIYTFLHVQTFVLKRMASLNKPMIFLSAFTCIIASVLAIIKDIPDLEGDKVHGIQSFVVQLGPNRVYSFCIALLIATYGVAVIIGLTSKLMWARVCTIIGHGIAASVLYRHASKVDPKDNRAVSRTYMLIWNLFYAEFFLAHFVR